MRRMFGGLRFQLADTSPGDERVCRNIGVGDLMRLKRETVSQHSRPERYHQFDLSWLPENMVEMNAHGLH